MLASGRSKTVAWAASGVLGLATVAGVLTMTFFTRSLTAGLPLSAGVTLYVAASDLIPEVNKEPGIRIALVVFLGVGLLVVLRHYFH
jgi:ZIP family zinc transporter/zinc and cadmium transporter